MIRITQDGDHINITGHSIPAVCASVSSIMYTSVNMLLKYAENSFEFNDNEVLDFVAINIKSHDRIIDMIIDNMFDMFNDLYEDGNSDKIEINRS